MEIQLLNCQAKSVSFEKSEQKIEASIHHGVGYKEDEPKSFAVYFKVSLPTKEGNILHIEYLATFSTSKKIDDEFKESHFPSINAPAIAYPYLRAFVSQFLLLSGYEPQILPTINFVKMQEQKENKNH